MPLNGHGGNLAFLEAPALESRHRLRPPILHVTYRDLVWALRDEIRERTGISTGHSGALETSIPLYLQPQLVVGSRPLAQGVTDDPSLGEAARGRRLMHTAAEGLADCIQRAAVWVTKHTLEGIAIGSYELGGRTARPMSAIRSASGQYL